MNESRSIRLHYLLRAGILLAFALYIGHLVQQDALHYYVSPELARWIRLCPVPLALMALSLAVQALFGKQASLCDCEHKLPRSVFRSAVLYGLFLVPLVFGFLLPDRPLGSLAASVKGMTLSFTDASKDRSGKNLFDSSDPFEAEFAELAKNLHEQAFIRVYPAIFSETFGAIDRYKEAFQGKEITATGFVYRENPAGAASGAFILSRFLVQCCTADATPFGVLVDPGTVTSLPPDTWVEVRGKLQIVKYKGRDTVQIAAKEMVPVRQPATPYIYTNADSIAAWEELQHGGQGIK